MFAFSLKCVILKIIEEPSGSTITFLRRRKMNEAKLEELVVLERRYHKLVEKLKDDLKNAIGEIKLPGVEVNDKAPFTAIVSFKNLITKSWSPVTYIPKEQARKVIEYLDGANTLDSICKKVELLLVNGYIGVSDRVYLHEYTVDVIRNSEIGRFVMAKINGGEKEDCNEHA